MRRALLSLTGLLSLVVSAPASAAPPHRAVVESAVPLVFEQRPAMNGSGRLLPALSAAPVTIHFASRPTSADVAALQSLGVVVTLGPEGAPRVYGNFLLADIPASAVDAVAALPRVERIALDGSPQGVLSPMDATAAEIQAPDVWGTALDDGTPVTGAGVTICDIDQGVDVFHPLLFRADGGYFDWVDLDGDRVFTPGVDGVDLDRDGAAEVLRIQNGIITHWSGSTPLFGSKDPSFELGMDYLYADVNGNQTRDYGPDAGFTEADPTYGERLFLVDDVNGNGQLDVGEKLVALGTSKVSRIRRKGHEYKRGEDLIEFPVDDTVRHGTAVAGELVGGTRGLTKVVGVAPDADFMVAYIDDFAATAKLADYCISRGARVVLHEYASWGIGAFLDGSTPLEQLIDETSQRPGAKGIVHATIPGNLGGSDKSYKHTLPAGGELTVPVEVSKAYAFTTFLVSLEWREPERELSFTLEDPNGFTMDLGTGKTALSTSWSDKWWIKFSRDVSARGTARVDAWVYSKSNNPQAPLVKGGWKLHVADHAAEGAPDLAVVGYVSDEKTLWDKGVHFSEFASEEHLILHPSTADHALTMAAYIQHAWFGGEPGVRAVYSGRGHRIDGYPSLWISAPCDPITSGYVPGHPGAYAVFSGTSGAGPHVAGAAALLLQANPDQNGLDVKEAIKKGALVDEAVGEAPNDDYGYGKLRIYQSLYGKAPPGGSAPSVAIAPVTAEVGKEVVVTIDADDADEPASGLFFDLDRDYDGVYDERLKAPSFSATFAEEGTYRAKVRVTDATGRERAAIAVIDVKAAAAPPPPAKPADRDDADEEVSEGCSISAATSGGGEGWLSVLAGLAILGWGRARRRAG